MMEIQTLQLSEKEFDKLFISKQATLRLGERNISNGPLLFESTEIKRRQIVNVWLAYSCPLKEVYTGHLEMNGYKDCHEAFLDLKQYYSDITLDSTVTNVCFQ